MYVMKNGMLEFVSGLSTQEKPKLTEAKPTMTRELAHAAASDAANAQMRAAGRTQWDMSDYAKSVEVFDTLWPEENDMTEAKRCTCCVGCILKDKHDGECTFKESITESEDIDPVVKAAYSLLDDLESDDDFDSRQRRAIQRFTTAGNYTPDAAQRIIDGLGKLQAAYATWNVARSKFLSGFGA